jgi:tetratricopeptide (TPR) repeat protein
MSEIQLVMMVVVGVIIYKVYESIQTLDPNIKPGSINEAANNREHRPTFEEMMQNAERAFENEEYETALTLFESTNTHYPKKTEVLNKFAFVLAALNQNERAINIYKQSIQIDDNDDISHNAIASTYRKLEEFEIAQEHYLKAIKIDNTYPITYYNYGNLLQDMGENAQAIEMYKKVLALDANLKEAQIEIDKLSSH